MKEFTPKEIWLAGLGALARSECEDDQWLKELLEEGEQFEIANKAELDRILNKMTKMSEAPKEPRRRRTKIDMIENTFENKVSQTLHSLGLVSKKEISQLKSRLASIETMINESNEHKSDS